MIKATGAISLILYTMLLVGVGFYVPDAPAIDWHAFSPSKPVARHKHK